MSKEPMSKSVPMEPSPLSKRFRLFKKKGHHHVNESKPRRRSQSFNDTFDTDEILPPTIVGQQGFKKLKLKITIEEAKQLTLDENVSNIYVIVRCLNQRHRTQVIKKSSAPNWQCTFDIPLFSLLSRKKTKQWRQGVIITVCSKDRFKSQFLGQIQIPFDTAAAEIYHNASTVPHWYPLSTNNIRRRNYLPRKRTTSESAGSLGEIKVKTGLILEGFEDQESIVTDSHIKHMWKMLTKYHYNHRSNTNTNNSPQCDSPVIKSSTSLPQEMGYYMTSTNYNSTNNSSYNNSPNAMVSAGSSEYFLNQHQIPADNMYYNNSPRSDIPSTPRKRRLRGKRKRNKRGLEGKFHKDVVGVLFLEIVHAKDLPPEKNLARTSFDMDPFVVISYGTSTFRTSAVRHNLNPVWNEKLFFHVRHHEANFQLKFTVYDRERLSGNDLIAWYQLPVKDIIDTSLQHGTIDLNAEEDDSVSMIEKEMDHHTFPLQMANSEKWKNKRPTLTIRAKFMPYDQIRKMFWIALAKNYDVESTGTLSRLEVQSMLEITGSTITESTIDKFWESHNKDPRNEDEELTIDELVECLEQHILAEEDEDSSNGLPILSQNTLNTDTNNESFAEEVMNNGLVGLNIYGTELVKDNEVEEIDDDDDSDDEEEEDEDEDWAGGNDEEDEDEEEDEDGLYDGLDDMPTTDNNEQSPFDTSEDDQLNYSTTLPSTPTLMKSKDIDLAEELIKEENKAIGKLSPFPSPMSRRYNSRGTSVEKIIRLKECPICHRPNLDRRSQMDIITHVATCAANDWTSVDRFLLGNFLTEAYAQRRWFVKLVRKVGYGKYSLGHDNANIIVQDRNTGQLIEEKMSVYIRLGMRLVYKGMKTSIQSKRAQRILTNLTIKQGRRFDNPNSVREIPAFIKFHKISLNEVQEPLSSFKTFNEFFYRKLKPGSRPPDSPEDPTVAVSPADSRMIAFESISEATRIWIKGVEFSLKKLLGGSPSASDYEGGSLAVFRLAPQDYHRFHFPVDGVVTKIKHISGQYYTVNPMAIRTTIDVFGDNARTIVWIDSKEFGKVAVVCVGAMLVGSIIITAELGKEVKRTDEMGYFAFGGSTLIVIFQKDKISFDHDLLNNSDKALETLVRVGNHIGNVV